MNVKEGFLEVTRKVFVVTFTRKMSLTQGGVHPLIYGTVGNTSPVLTTIGCYVSCQGSFLLIERFCVVIMVTTLLNEILFW